MRSNENIPKIFNSSEDSFSEQITENLYPSKYIKSLKTEKWLIYY